jgi:hypothetical protein
MSPVTAAHPGYSCNMVDMTMGVDQSDGLQPPGFDEPIQFFCFVCGIATRVDDGTFFGVIP